MSKKTTQLEVEITALAKKVKNLEEAITKPIKIRFNPCSKGVFAYYSQAYDLKETLEAIFEYLNVNIREISSEKVVKLEKIKPVRPKYSTRAKGIGEKNASKK